MNVLLIIGLLLGALFVVFVLFSIALAVLGVTVTTISAAWHAGKPAERRRRLEEGYGDEDDEG